MRINHNIPAMNAHRLLGVNNLAGSKTLEKLSSGKRINRAGDDAAGMAISEKMRAQIKGLQMASRNSLDGVSLVQTAEGAMNEVHSMLQRMRELSVQAANGTSAESDRQAIQQEINQLTSEINRVSNGTEYNTRNVLKGNEGPNANALVHRMSTGKPAQLVGNVNIGIKGPPAFDLKSEHLSIWIDNEEKVVNLTQTSKGTTLSEFIDLINDAFGDSAKAAIDKDGKMEITTSSIGGLSKIEIKGSNNATRTFVNNSVETIANTSIFGAEGFEISAGIENGVIANNLEVGFSASNWGVPARASFNYFGRLVISLQMNKTYSASDIQAIIRTATDDLLTKPNGLDVSKFTVEGTATIVSNTDVSDIGWKEIVSLKERQPASFIATGKAENATSKSEGTFYFNELPEVGSTIKIGSETIEFFDSSLSPYVGSNRPIDLNGKLTSEAVADEIVNKFGTGIDGVTIEKDAKFSGDNARIIVKADKTGFDGNLIYLEATPKDFTTNLQVGSNTGQGFRLQIGDMRAKNLKISADNPTRNTGVKGASYVSTGATVTDGISSSMVEYAVDVTTEEKATAAITVFNNAIVQVAAERSRLGATQNRLEHTISNLDNTAENLTSAMSRIEDTDMALEMSEFQKLNVLQQAGVSMLAQANQQPQSILKLLG